jgi:hypothetical protein
MQSRQNIPVGNRSVGAPTEKKTPSRREVVEPCKTLSLQYNAGFID